MTEILPYIRIDSGDQPQHSIIWLHGLGADGNDFVPLVKELKLPAAVRFIFPHAPQRPVTINGGYVMRAWYDIAGQTIDAKQDESGIRSSQKAIEALISQELTQGISADRIFLAGFSQGGAIALHTAIRQNDPLAGVLALSTYLPLSDRVVSESLPASKATPIFMAHGRNDPIVPFELGTASRDRMKGMGYQVEWHDYPMQHSVCDAELRNIENWLAACLMK